MLVRLLVVVDMFGVFSLLLIGKRKKTIFFDIKCHDSYFSVYTLILPKNIQYGDTRLTTSSFER